MSTKNVEIRNAVASVKATETRQDSQSEARAYRTPELHVVGKAGDLVQGGGGNRADNNRAAQY